MKSTGTLYWNSPNTGATNESGFSGLPDGFRDFNGGFLQIGEYGYWWSSTEGGAEGAWGRYLDVYNGNVNRSSSGKEKGLSVRCLKD
jgi:uncharacterized protein (TIGR02145 family)